MAKKKPYKWNLLEDGLTQTQILKYLECKHKFYLSLVRGWAQELLSDSIWFGILFHDCLELWYEGADDDPMAIAHSIVSKHELEEAVHKWPKVNRQQWEFLVCQLYAVFPAYCNWYEEEDESIEWESLEEVFKVPLDVTLGDGKKIIVPITGKMDGKCKIKKQRMIFETKTKGRMNVGGIRNTVAKDFQVNLYLWAANQQRGNRGTRYNAVCYNMIHRPQLRLTQKESYADHTKRVFDTVSKVGMDYFCRITVPLKANQEKTFAVCLQRIVREIAEFVLWDKAISEDRFSPACLGPWGVCSMRGLCYDGDAAGLSKRPVPFTELEG